MADHKTIDMRSLEIAAAIVNKIENDPLKNGLQKAYSVCMHWYNMHHTYATQEWLEILKNKKWEEIKKILLDPSEEGKRLRQNSPFCGILTPKERWSIYKRFWKHDKTSA
jgi:hypothetical protein